MAVLTPSMSSFWTLSSVLTDSSANGYTLTNNNVVTFGTGKVYANAATFVRASTQSLSRASNADLVMGAGVSWTIAAWAKIASKPTFMSFISKDDYGTGSREYNLHYDGNVDRWGVSGFAATGGSGGVTVRGDAFGAVTTGVWCFIVAQFDDANDLLTIQVNNGPINSVALTTTFGGTAPFRIGSLSSNGSGTAGEAFDGNVEGVGVWKRLLTSNEKTLLYQEGDGLANALWQSYLPLNRSGAITGICGRGGYTPTDTHSYQMHAFECLDGTGINFQQYPSNCVNNTGHKFRDPDRIYVPSTGKYWAGCINELDSLGVPGNGVSSSWDLYSSIDGIDWTFVTSVDCSAITGAGSGRRCWKPRFLLDASAPQGVRIYLGLAKNGTGVPGAIHEQDGQPYVYEMHPTSADFTAFSVPVIISGTSLPITTYDPQCQLINGTYVLTYVNYAGWSGASPLYIEVMTSSSPTSGFVVLKAGDWGFGSTNQGPNPMQRPDGKQIMYLDGPGGEGMYYSLSSVAGNYLDVLNSLTNVWGTPAKIVIHGFANTQPHFVIEGSTIRFNPFDRLAGGGAGSRMVQGLALAI